MILGYKTILKNGVYEFEERRSIFIGYASNVESDICARDFINEIKSKNSDARHNVYGYIIGEKLMLQRYTDDGEPQGTAGIPIINVIKNNFLSDVVVVVTRYFGGVLLGTGGLTRAYVKAANGAIMNSKIVDKILGNELKLKMRYDIVGRIQHFLNENNIHVPSVDYEERVVLKIRCDKNNVQNIKSKLIDITSNSLDIEISEDTMYFKDNNKYYLRSEV